MRRRAGRTASGRAPASRRAGRAPRTTTAPGSTATTSASESPSGFGRRGERVANVPRGSSSRNAGTVSSQPVVSWRCASTQTCEKPATSRRLPRCGSVISIREGPGVVGDRLQGHPVQRGVRGADAADRRVHDRLRDAPVAERLDERERRPRGREAPEREGRVEPLRGRRARLEISLRPGEERGLGREQGLRVAGRPVEQEQLHHQRGAELADVVDRRGEPRLVGTAAGRGRGEHRPRRPFGARLAPRGPDEPLLGERLERAVDERARRAPDPADLPVGPEEAHDRPAVRRSLGEEPEDDPLDERELRADRACQSSIVSPRRLR